MDKARNEMLTQVGPGTPMGELLRRYWHPIAGASELDDNPIKPMRLMGEDLVLYKDLSGTLRPGRPALPAPPRRPVLRLRRGDGIRCNYHGWLYDEHGALRRAAVRGHVQPGRAAAQEMHQQGLSGAGEWPACCGPTWARSRRPSCRTGSRSLEQRLHADRRLPRCRATGSSARKTRSTRCTSSGCTTTGACASAARPDPTRRRTSSSASTSSSTASSTGASARTPTRTTRCGRSAASACGRTASILGEHFEWRVPVDDENTLSVTWFFTRVPTESEPYVQNRIPTWYGPIKDADGPLDHQPRHQPGHHRLGRPGHDRRPQQGDCSARATAASR